MNSVPEHNLATSGCADPHWTGVTLTSFEPYFSKLPPEVRVRVWFFVVAEPRIIELEPNPDNDQIITCQKTPGYLQACRESRYEGLKIYETLAPESRSSKYSRMTGWSLVKQRPARILIDFEIDTIIFKSDLFITREAVALAAKGMPIKHEKIKYMGVHYSGCLASQNSFTIDILKCTNLQKFFVAFEDYRGSCTEIFEEYPQPTVSVQTAEDVPVAGYQCVEYRNCSEITRERIWKHVNLLSVLEADVYSYNSYEDRELMSYYGNQDKLWSESDSLPFSFKESTDKVIAKRSRFEEQLKEISKLSFYQDGSKKCREAEASFNRANEEYSAAKQVVSVRLNRSATNMKYYTQFEIHKNILMRDSQMNMVIPRLDFINRYLNLRIQYRHEDRTRRLKPKRNPGIKSLGPDPSRMSGYDLENFVENSRKQQVALEIRKKDDPNGMSKRQIMSRRGLGRRPFGLRESYPMEDFWKPVEKHSKSLEQEISQRGKKKLTGPISTRKARATLVRDRSVYYGEGEIARKWQMKHCHRKTGLVQQKISAKIHGSEYWRRSMKYIYGGSY